jgi:CHASE3 domain sensor protein
VEIFAFGAVAIFIFGLISYLGDKRLRRWRRQVDTTPQDMRRADDGLEGKNEPPSTTWMYPTT